MSDIPSITPDDDFKETKECDYKGEHYSVRDNGAIMRHARCRRRPLDEIWTFGEKDVTTGYMVFRSERVHRIVATAFHGLAPSSQHVVDHIDTNRCNNRPENLRWLTKLENILLNENTLAKVIYICGSVDAFLANPDLLFGHESEDANFYWMRTVSSEEAKATKENLKRLASRPKDVASKGTHVGDWIFKEHRDEWQPDFSKRDRPNVPSSQPEKTVQALTVNDLKFTGEGTIHVHDTLFDRPMLYDGWGNQIGPQPTRQEDHDLKENNVSEYFETSNKLAQQIGWRPYTKPEFPCCPNEVSDDPLQEYDAKLTEGAIFVTATYGSSTVYKHVVHDDQLLVVTKIPNGVKGFGMSRITWNGKVFIHESMGTFFEENGVLAAFTRAQGLVWDGPESIDDYC